MKFLILLAVSCSFLLAQNQPKQILIERQSSASCPNCRTAHQKFQPFIEDIEESVVVIAYQFHGGLYFDPMGSFAKELVSERMQNYYQNGSFPTAFVDGGNRVHLNQTLSLTPSEEQAELSIKQNAAITGNMVNLKIELTNETGNGSIRDPNTRVFAVLKEDVVEFESSAGANGETIFYDVLRYMFGNPNGFMINWEDGKASLELSQVIDLQKVDPNQLYAAVFVQNVTTREVFQANEVKVDLTANLDDNNFKNIILYPNPTKDDIFIEGIDFGASYKIVNNLGIEVISGKYNGIINISDLNTGTYFININSKTLKFIKD